MLKKQKQKIKDLPHVDRPREKLLAYGPGKLSTTELLALILGSGKKGENVIALAEKILKRVGKRTLPDAGVHELQAISGLGPAKVAEIIACFELGKRLIHDTSQTLQNFSFAPLITRHVLHPF